MKNLKTFESFINESKTTFDFRGIEYNVNYTWNPGYRQGLEQQEEIEGPEDIEISLNGEPVEFDDDTYDEFCEEFSESLFDNDPY